MKSATGISVSASLSTRLKRKPKRGQGPNACAGALLGCLILWGCSTTAPSDDSSEDGSGGMTAGVGGGLGTGGEAASGGAVGTGGFVGTGGALGSGGSVGSTGGGTSLGGCGTTEDPPPETWQEHWFEHEQLVSLVYSDEHVAIYFDSDMDEEESSWLYDFISRSWAYTKEAYGCHGQDLLYAIFHKDKYFGGHPSYFYDSSHDNRNVTDQGGGSWVLGDYDVASHEIAHVVESAANNHQGSPAFGLWMDSKWAEFYQYDLYLALGLDEEAERVFDSFSAKSESYPDTNPNGNSYWFRDWFYPLWSDYGGASVMANFFGLLGEHFEGGGMNWGEYIHFTSGAAGVDLKPLATEAFGWPAEWESQYSQAKIDYPGVTY